MRTARRLALALAIALGLTALAWSAEKPPRPAQATIAGVPFVKQRGDWCGPAALACVLGFYGHADQTQPVIAKAIYLHHARGTLNLDLMLYARQLGHPAEGGRGDLDALRQAVSEGCPVIATVKLPRNELHYVVVYGYDDSTKILRMHTGFHAARAIKYARFEADWKAASNWMLLIKPKPPPAPPADQSATAAPG